MAGSFSEALEMGVPIVLTSKDGIPQVICEPGKERQALETMQKLGLIKLVRPKKHQQREMTDKELLTEVGFMVECESPFEISHVDGSRATGLAARMIMRMLRDEEEQKG